MMWILRAIVLSMLIVWINVKFNPSLQDLIIIWFVISFYGYLHYLEVSIKITKGGE